MLIEALPAAQILAQGASCPPDCAWVTAPLSGAVGAVALWPASNRPIVAYSGDPSTPSLHWLRVPDAPIPLPLGARAQAVRLYPLDGTFALLWEDGADPNALRLLVAALRPDGGVERFPTAVSARAVLGYAAAMAPNGGLTAVWVERSTPTTPVFVTEIDGVGRPRPSRQIADDGAMPTVLYDSTGRGHVGWLARGPGGLWTAYHTLIGPSEPRPAPIGLFRLGDSEFVTGYALALGGGRVYALWRIGKVGPSGAVTVRIGGVTFPEDAPTDTQEARLAGLPAGSTHFTIAGGPSGAESVLVWATAEGVYAAGLGAEGIRGATQLSRRPSGVLGTLTAVSDGRMLYLAWPSLAPNGQTMLHTLMAPAP